MKRSVFDKKFLLLGLVLVLAFLPFISSATNGPCDAVTGLGCDSNEVCTSGGVCVPLSPSSTSSDGVICEKIPTTWPLLKERCNIWLNGPSSESDINVIGQIAKWILLFIVIFLIYSALAAANFPEKLWAKIVLSILVGFLGTFLVTTNELISIMQGYTGLGVTIGVFLPFMILGFFTVMVAKSMSPIGIYLQKVMWIVFSFYMLFKTFILFGLRSTSAKVDPTTGIVKLFGWLSYKTDEVTTTIANNSDPTILIVFAIACIASLFIMLSNKIVLRWFAKEELDAAIQAEGNKIKKSNAYDSLRAQEMDADKKVR